MDQHLDSAVGRLEKAFKRIEILEAKALKQHSVGFDRADLYCGDDSDVYEDTCVVCGLNHSYGHSFDCPNY